MSNSLRSVGNEYVAEILLRRLLIAVPDLAEFKDLKEMTIFGHFS